jgi:hypothetical protein
LVKGENVMEQVWGQDSQLRMLRTVFPEFNIRLITVDGRRAFQAIRVRGQGHLWSVTSTDATALLQVLKIP